MSIAKSSVLQCDGCGALSAEARDWTPTHTDDPNRIFHKDICEGCWKKMCDALGIQDRPGMEATSPSRKEWRRA